MSTHALKDVLEECTRLPVGDDARTESRIVMITSRWTLWNEAENCAHRCTMDELRRALLFLPHTYVGANFPSLRYHVQSTEWGVPVTTLLEFAGGKIVQTGKTSEEMLFVAIYMMCRIISGVLRAPLRPAHISVTNTVVLMPWRGDLMLDRVEACVMHLNTQQRAGAALPFDEGLMPGERVVWPIVADSQRFPVLRVRRKIATSSSNGERTQLFNVHTHGVCCTGNPSIAAAARACDFFVELARHAAVTEPPSAAARNICSSSIE